MAIMRIVLLLSLISAVGSFAPSVQRFALSTKLHAAGPPQYEKRGAVLREAEIVGDGSAMLHIDLADDDEKEALDYQPGHVLALEMKVTDKVTNKKTIEDAKKNEGWMRGPYTVSRATANSIDILIKVVGEKSRAMAQAKPGTPFRFGGKFKVPICEGINKETTKRIVLISTGVGIGPCVGAIEQMFRDNSFSSNEIALYASFRNEGEVLYADYLNGFAEFYPDRFQWKPLVTSVTGRVSTDDNLQNIAKEDTCSLTETHYHLIGNGQLVNEWKAGLAKAGVPEDKVTFEAYFNHQAETNDDAIERISNAISASALSPVA